MMMMMTMLVVRSFRSEHPHAYLATESIQVLDSIHLENRHTGVDVGLQIGQNILGKEINNIYKLVGLGDTELHGGGTRSNSDEQKDGSILGFPVALRIGIIFLDDQNK